MKQSEMVRGHPYNWSGFWVKCLVYDKIWLITWYI